MKEENRKHLNPLLVGTPTKGINNFVYQNVGEDTNDGGGQIKTNHS